MAEPVRLAPKPPKQQPTMQQQFPALANLVGAQGQGAPQPAGGGRDGGGAATEKQPAESYLFLSDPQSNASQVRWPVPVAPAVSPQQMHAACSSAMCTALTWHLAPTIKQAREQNAAACRLRWKPALRRCIGLPRTGCMVKCLMPTGHRCRPPR